MADYDLVVIGAGSGGLTAAQFGADLGAKVALIERNRIGGDCTWTGCVPSKALLHVAKTVHTAKTAVSLGLALSNQQVDMRRVKAQIQQVIADVYQHETPEKLRDVGIDVFMGHARFVDAHTVQIGEQAISSRTIILATGARPFLPPVPGLDSVPFVTTEQIFDNERLPQQLIVLGAGPIGVELAHAYRRFGAQAVLIDQHLLPMADGDAQDALGRMLCAQGVQFVQGLATAVSHNSAGEISVAVGEQVFVGDMLLVATGRLPNVNGLDLEKADVAYSSQGISVNGKLQTSQKHIFAVGDCTGGFQFTHYAGWQGFQAVRNALLPGSASGVRAQVPWTVFVDPEIAQVGLTETAARQQFGEGVQVAQQPMDRVDRGITDQAVDGFVKIVHRDGRILGASIVAARAGEMINEFAIAMQHGLKIQDLAETMHVYPTYGMGIQRLLAALATDSFLQSSIGKIALRLAGF